MTPEEMHWHYNACTHKLVGHHSKRPTIKQKLQSLVEALDGDELGDYYGTGPYLQRFEEHLCQILGKPAALFMPSGTMAQQIALRIHCDRQRNWKVVMHPTSHLVGAEHAGYSFLHQLQRLQFGAPERVRNRLLSVADLSGLPTLPGAVLLELPYRPLGCQLPEWDVLQGMSNWAKERGVPFHLDGARLWQCRPFYQRTYAEITELFDSVYVSFYKDLGGFCGAALLGEEDFVKEARMWLRMHGGNLYSQEFNYVSANVGLERVLPQIDAWVEKAKLIAQLIQQFEVFTVNPSPPHTNTFHIYAHTDIDQINQRLLWLAKEHSALLFYPFRPTSIPGVCETELHCFGNALDFDLQYLQFLLEELLQKK